MELLFVVMGAALIGLIPRYLLPAVSAAVAAAVWAGLTWLGWPFDGGWIWWASLVAGGLVALVLPIAIAPRRKRDDEALFERLIRP
jgi:hypothetical protein